MQVINRPQAQENASDQVAIGFTFACDWLRGLREFSRPITERTKVKPMLSRITFDTQLKIALLERNEEFLTAAFINLCAYALHTRILTKTQIVITYEIISTLETVCKNISLRVVCVWTEAVNP